MPDGSLTANPDTHPERTTLLSWNYRITHETIDGASHYGLREVYYGRAGDPVSWTTHPVTFSGESPQDILEDFLLAGDAWSLGVLDLDTRKTFPFWGGKGAER